jgi:hypothetical protein
MKSRIIWAVIVLAAVVGFYVVTIKPTQTHSPGFSRKRPPLRDLKPEIAPPPLPQPIVSMPVIAPPTVAPISIPPVGATRETRRVARPEVPIQDNATIDFTYGSPQVRVQGKDQEALDRALKEMADAVKDVTFPPAEPQQQKTN